MTKHLDANKIQEHLERMSIEYRTGRSDRAANMYTLGWGKQGEGYDEADDNGSGDGDEQGNEDSAIQWGRQYDSRGRQQTRQMVVQGARSSLDAGAPNSQATII